MAHLRGRSGGSGAVRRSLPSAAAGLGGLSAAFGVRPGPAPAGPPHPGPHPPHPCLSRESVSAEEKSKYKFAPAPLPPEFGAFFQGKSGIWEREGSVRDP